MKSLTDNNFAAMAFCLYDYSIRIIYIKHVHEVLKFLPKNGILTVFASCWFTQTEESIHQFINSLLHCV